MSEQSPQKKRQPRSIWALYLLTAMLLLFFIASRAVEHGDLGYIITIHLGLIAAALALVIRVWRFFARTPSPKTESRLLVSSIIVCASALWPLFLFAGLDPAPTQLGEEAGAPLSILDTILNFGWVIILLISFCYTVFVEFAYREMDTWLNIGRQVDEIRLWNAAHSSLVISLTFSILGLANYLVAREGIVWHVNLSSAIEPVYENKQLVAAAPEPIIVKAFYPPNSTTKPMLKTFFDRLAADNPAQLDVEWIDPAVHVNKAEEYNVQRPGRVVIAYRDKKEPFSLHHDRFRASYDFQSLNERFFRAVNTVVREKATICISTGHGELSRSKKGNFNMPPLSIFANNFRIAFDFKDVSPQNLIEDGVDPATCSILFIPGPQKGFSPDELNAIKAYQDSGGSLLIAAGHIKDASTSSKDSTRLVGGLPLPEGSKDSPISPLLELVGLEHKNVIVIDKIFPAERPDPRFILARNFSKHDSINEFRARGEDAIFPESSILKIVTPPTLKIHKAVQSSDQATSLDPKNPENGPFVLGAAVTPQLPHLQQTGDANEEKKSWKAFVLASRWAVIENYNAHLLSSILRWLNPVEAFEHISTPVFDPPPRFKSSKEMKKTFWTVIIAAPLIIALFGFIFLGRRSRRSEKGL